MNTILVVVLVVGAMALFQAVFWLSGSRGERSEADPIVPGLPRWDREPALAGSAGLAAALQGVPGVGALRGLQVQAGSTSTTASVIGGCLAAAIVLQVGVTLVTGSVTAGLVGGILGSTMPVVLLLVDRGRREAEVSEALPRALRSMIRLARGGHGLNSAIVEAARELEGPLASELARVYGEQREGRALDESLRALARRVPGSLDLHIFVHALLLAQESAMDLGQLLDRIEGTLNARIDNERRIRAELTQARMSAGILCAMPPIGAASLYALKREYLESALADPLGRALYQGATVWMGLGLVVALLLLFRKP